MEQDEKWKVEKRNGIEIQRELSGYLEEQNGKWNKFKIKII